MKRKLNLSFLMIVLLLFLAGVAVSCGKEGTPTSVARIADITWISECSTGRAGQLYALAVEMKPRIV